MGRFKRLEARIYRDVKSLKSVSAAKDIFLGFLLTFLWLTVMLLGALNGATWIALVVSSAVCALIGIRLIEVRSKRLSGTSMVLLSGLLPAGFNVIPLIYARSRTAFAIGLLTIAVSPAPTSLIRPPWQWPSPGPPSPSACRATSSG